MRSKWRLGLAWLAVGFVAAGLLGLGPAPQESSPYVDSQVGDMPLILSAPHGGRARPASIPDRSQAVVVNDWGSQVLARDLADEIERRSGRQPHLIVNRLHRSKLDPNRGLDHGAQGDPVAAGAWHDYHAGIEAAGDAVVSDCGWGLYVDLHSFGEWGRGVEIGYGLTPEQLSEEDQDLSKRRFVYDSNLRNAALYSGRSLADLIRGPQSLGALLEAEGYWAVPSPEHPEPRTGYYDGGYSVYWHGPQRGAGLDALQIEVPYNLLRDANRERFVGSLAGALLGFLEVHYGMRPDRAVVCTGFADLAWDHWALESVRAQQRAGRAAPCQERPRRFCPGSALDRGQAAALIWRALHGDPLALEGTVGFVDVEGMDSAQAIGALWRQGILDSCGLSPLHYCPERPMRRADLAVVALRVRDGPGVIPARPKGFFVDSPVGDWSSWWLEAAVQRELLPPCSRGAAFGCPDHPVSRAEAAWAMARATGFIR